MTPFLSRIKLTVAMYVATLSLLVLPFIAVAQAVETAAQASPGTEIAFYVIAAAFGIFGVGAIVAARWINANVSNTMLKSVLLRLDDVVFTVVKEINQTIVDASRDPTTGKLLPDAAERAKAAALAKVKAYLGADGLKLLLKVFGIGADTDAIIASKIEAAVHDVKALKATASVP
jgi:hypothetical protein